MLPNQIQAARVGLNMTRKELGDAVMLSEATILRMEKPRAKSSSLSTNRDKVVAFLKGKGVTFDEGGSVTIPTEASNA